MVGVSGDIRNHDGRLSVEKDPPPSSVGFVSPRAQRYREKIAGCIKPLRTETLIFPPSRLKLTVFIDPPSVMTVSFGHIVCDAPRLSRSIVVARSRQGGMGTSPGVMCVVVDPSPSWPYRLSPQQ